MSQDGRGIGPQGEERGRQPNPQHQAASKRVQQTQAQVDEVVGIMRVNIDKVLERDQKLSELDDRAGEKLLRMVVDIVKTNVEKVLERDHKLSELDDRADALQQGASQFEQQAGKLKRKFWWKNCKMWAIIIGIVVVIVVIIIVYAVTQNKNA